MKTLTPEQRELFSQALLRVLDLNPSRYGLNVRSLGMHIRQFAFEPEPDEIESTLNYLDSLDLTMPVNKGEFHPEARSWRITHKGTNYLRERGL